MAQTTLRQAIQQWHLRFQLTGMGLVAASLRPTSARDEWSCSGVSHDESIDSTLAHLARRTPQQFTVELSYPWGREDGDVGALLGLIPEPLECDAA